MRSRWLPIRGLVNSRTAVIKTGNWGMRKVKCGGKKAELQWLVHRSDHVIVSTTQFYRMPRVAGAMVNCVIQMRKVASYRRCLRAFDIVVLTTLTCRRRPHLHRVKFPNWNNFCGVMSFHLVAEFILIYTEMLQLPVTLVLLSPRCSDWPRHIYAYLPLEFGVLE